MTSNEDEGDDESVVMVASFIRNGTRAIPPGSLIVVTIKNKNKTFNLDLLKQD